MVKSWDSATVYRRTRKLTIRADRILRVRVHWKPLFQDDAVLPAIAKVIGVDNLGADLPQYIEKTHLAFTFDRRHPHAPVFRVWLAEVSLAGAERSEEYTSDLQSRQYLVC